MNAHATRLQWPPTQSFAQSIGCIYSDVDGVLTDGSLIYDSAGVEAKAFHVRDGLAIKRWITAGNHFVIVTARHSEMTDRRAAELGIEVVIQNCKDKLAAVLEHAGQFDVDPRSAAFVGDDVADVAAMRAVGLAVTVSDGSIDAVAASDVRLGTGGGRGALRELIETLMRAAGSWPAIPSAREAEKSAAPGSWTTE